MRKIMWLIIASLVIVAVFSGCSVLQKLGILNDGSSELRPVSSIVLGEDEAKKLTDKVPIHLYFASEDNTKLKKEIRYIPLSEAKKSASNLASVIVKELIKGPSQGSSLLATIPAGTQLRSPVTIDAGVATVDFTKEFIEKHPGGRTAEQLTIFSIVNSLTELKEIQKVKFLIDGKSSKEFKGVYKFDVPFSRSDSIISKDIVTSLPSDTDELEDEAVDQENITGDPEDVYIELEEEEEILE